MGKLSTIEIDDAPENVAAMMDRGHFHAWQDGMWRYSPFGGETVYCNDPTAKFDAQAQFSDGVTGAVHVGLCLMARRYRDGTRGLDRWDARRTPVVWQMYAPAYPGDREWREWIASHFT